MGIVNDKIKNVIRNWLEIQPSVGDTITIQETNTFEGNCFRNLLWYRGDASELHQYYTQTDDLMGNAKFWAAQSTTGINIRKIHTGLPAMIVDMLADIIVDSFNKIEVKGNNEAQTNWEEIAKENARNGVINKTRYTRLLESHFSLDNVLKFLASNDLRYVKNIILCHLSDTNSNQMIMQNRVYEQTKIKTTIARPGLDLELKLYPF